LGTENPHNKTENRAEDTRLKAERNPSIRVVFVKPDFAYFRRVVMKQDRFCILRCSKLWTMMKTKQKGSTQVEVHPHQ